MSFFDHDGIRFHYLDEGEGVPVVWQHGLSSDTELTFAVLGRPEERPPGIRLLGLDMRAHGETRPVGDPRTISLAAYADDLEQLLDRLGVERAVIGGVSMGAAVALNFALRHPNRVLGMVLSRPAWLDRPLPENLRVFTHAAQYLVDFGAEEGLRRFRALPEFEVMEREAPDCAQTLVNQFVHPRAEECAARLERIPHDAPSQDRTEWQTITVPTLILGNRYDPIHPWEYAQTLAQEIPGAIMREITSKSVDLERHAEDTRHFFFEFMGKQFSAEIGAGS